jgi:hypothetical protein
VLVVGSSGLCRCVRVAVASPKWGVMGGAGLIDHEVIPLSLTLADTVIMQLLAAATEVREAIDQARRN